MFRSCEMWMCQLVYWRGALIQQQQRISRGLSEASSARRPCIPPPISFAPGIAGAALCNFPRCALFVCVLYVTHFPALRVDEAPHHVAVLENPPGCDASRLQTLRACKCP